VITGECVGTVGVVSLPASVTMDIVGPLAKVSATLVLRTQSHPICAITFFPNTLKNLSKADRKK
jgi:hypothetical protein